MLNNKLVVLRVRKDVPGIGRKLSRYFNANEVTCGSRPKLKVPDNAVVFNYGRSEWPIWYQEAIPRNITILNSPDAVRKSVDKIKTLDILKAHDIPCLASTTDREVASMWTMEAPVYCRTTTTSKQGKGIVIAHSKEQVVDAPLYTRAYDKTHEFRVHVFNGEVIDYVQKKRMGAKKLAERGLSEVDNNLRNHKRGWVFAHTDIIRDKFVENLALDTVDALGLDYAGIDILARVKDGFVVNAVVCESNSAPGLSSPTTFKAYTNAISKFIEERNNA